MNDSDEDFDEVILANLKGKKRKKRKGDSISGIKKTYYQCTSSFKSGILCLYKTTKTIMKK